MKRYLKIFLALISNNIIRAMEYRSDFYISMILNIAWVVLQFWVILTLYQYTNNILGWTKEQTIVLYGLVRTIKGLFDMFIRKNLFNFPDDVNQGQLDYTLTKPIKSLFLVSFRYQIHSEISTLVTGITILIYSLYQVRFSLDLISVAKLLIAVPLALLVYYSIFMILVTFSIFIARFTAMNDLHDLVSQTMRYPTDIFTRNKLGAEIILLPITMIATYPASVILNKTFALGIFFEMVISLTIFFLMWRFWNFALKHYSSASS